ncbi:MAG TPA: hypothetical protein VJ063_11150 [Verrucomicrobiae bacterium]|nr:hypothetical protein [Verrucomicrobiae bacterium]
MKVVLTRQNDSDEMVVNCARKRTAVMKQFRWFMLGWGLCFLVMAVYLTVKAISRLQALDERQLTMGFVHGLALGITWVAVGLLSGLCIAKFLVGCRRDCRESDLLVRYHDRLQELEELPE